MLDKSKADDGFPAGPYNVAGKVCLATVKLYQFRKAMRQPFSLHTKMAIAWLIPADVGEGAHDICGARVPHRPSITNRPTGGVIYASNQPQTRDGDAR